ncbi:MAG: c-type cytochrome [Caulobacterales bacterium]
MKSTLPAVTVIAALAAGAAISTIAAPQPPGGGQVPWGRCCGTGPWPQGQGGMMGGGMMGSGSMQRHHTGMMGGVPEPYTNLVNPLPRTAATVEQGEKVYTDNCAACHGATGLGDGPAGRALSPRPANLAWLSRMPMGRWDPYMYWTIAEGGAPFGTAMPSFKDSLSKQETWAVIAYIQARLPAKSR